MEAAEGREPTFRERKAAELRQETASLVEPTPQPDVAAEAIPTQSLESAEEVPDESLPDGDIEPELGLVEEGGLDDETPADDYQDDGELSEESVDWKKRFEDTQRKLSEVSDNRTAMEQEHTELMSRQLQLSHEMEDKFTEAKRYAQAYVGGFDQQIVALEQAFNTGQIEPDNLPQARQQYQALVNQRNQLTQQMEHLNAQEKEAREVQRQRQAEMARIRLNRTIPGWGREKHRELGEYAIARGFTAEEFSENLDYRFLELLNDSMQLRTAGDTVKDIKRQKKAAGPRRNAKPQPRSANGRYKKAQDEFRANPGQRGRFAAMKAAELAKERGR